MKKSCRSIQKFKGKACHCRRALWGFYERIRGSKLRRKVLRIREIENFPLKNPFFGFMKFDHLSFGSFSWCVLCYFFQSQENGYIFNSPLLKLGTKVLCYIIT